MINAMSHAVVRATDREREILELVCRGRSDKEITVALGISLGTLRTHLSRLFLKTGLHGRTALAAAYVEAARPPLPTT
jgi:DNA-binding CsgD family transcriptional regulator